MATTEQLEDAVDSIFGTAFNVRDGQKIPATEDVANNAAVKLDATFLYADLAGSSSIAKNCPWDTTAKIIRAYLSCSVRIIKSYEGEIRSFDGDRVMGVFIGGSKNTNAVKAAHEIYWTTENIIQKKAKDKFASVSNNNVKIRQACGIAKGETRAVRAGIRNNNDLIWIGEPPSLAAKLSDIREYPHCTFISSAVYNNMSDDVKSSNGTNMWESRTFTYAGETKSLYRSSWWRKP